MMRSGAKDWVLYPLNSNVDASNVRPQVDDQDNTRV